jgi:exodeoxyribonuclease VII large subunit
VSLFTENETNLAVPKGSGMGTADNPLPIGDLTDLIKGKLESSFNKIVVVGEISNFKAHPSGHYYFSLKDSKATISAVMFRHSNAKLKFKAESGLKVIAFGKITVYPPRGNYQILITRMEPEGVGALQLAFEQLKKKLKESGVFDEAHKKPIPKFPRKMALVTATSGAAIRDMLNVLDRRFAGIEILIYPVKVQGQGSAEEISTAIDHLNKYFKDIDVLIAGRGGGSIEDLWAFNEEIVARSIFNSRIPVISAVGHEVDFTIADFVADLRAPTPSAAAELVIGNKVELLKHLDHLVSRLLQVRRKLEMAQLKIDDLLQRMLHSVESKVNNVRLSLERLKGRLSQRSPAQYLDQIKHQLELYIHRMQKVPEQIIEKNKWKVEKLESQLRLLNPHTIMSRGYSIVRNLKTKKVVKKAADVRMGDELLIELSKGKIKAKV